MTLLRKTYGKDHVRIMRIDRTTERHDVRELTVRAMLAGDFDAAFTDGDNATSVATDTVKNVINIVARENITLNTELFCTAVAQKLLDQYPSVDCVTVSGYETKWSRLAIDGEPHAHSFLLDGNGKPFARVVGTRGGTAVESGVSGFTFMKSTQSGWEHYIQDSYTTLPETNDRIAATSMDATWHWNMAPENYEIANARILDAMLKLFATTYSKSLQDSLYRMGKAALVAIPELATITLACPNKHYIPINLTPFGITSDNVVFTPTDEPHGQIECTVGCEK
ncbi:MAG: urate oxidase [Acetobacteraceae bacterium]|nr:urate oxidase [Acetobacteraceae bacterium]